MKHANIPIFIPHMGCPNDCVFCNQRKITGHTEFDAESVIPQIDDALETLRGKTAQIAFFGGSFTGIDRSLMIRLLNIGYGYIRSGRVESLRCSTRPDYINDEILDVLQSYGVKTVELGIQSTSEDVLRACRRGHTRDASVNAMHLVKAHGMELIGQMMTCLPRSTPKDEIQTSCDICACGADGARIYPLVVFKDTALEVMVKNGEYTPVSPQENILRAKEVKKVFLKNRVPVIRLGLQAQDNLSSDKDIAYGVYQPSIGASVDGAIYLELVEKELEKYDAKTLECGFLNIGCARGESSSLAGANKENKCVLLEKYGLYKIKITEKDNMKPFEINVRVTPDTRRKSGCI